MTDKKDKPFELELDDEEFDWDDALDEWEAELETHLSEVPGAQSGAKAVPVPAIPAPPRPLYRPPAPPPEPESEKPGPISEVPLDPDMFDDDEDEVTTIGDPAYSGKAPGNAPPAEAEATPPGTSVGTANERPTSPPSDGGVDLDLDGFLDDLSGGSDEEMKTGEVDPFGGLLPLVSAAPAAGDASDDPLSDLGPDLAPPPPAPGYRPPPPLPSVKKVPASKVGGLPPPLPRASAAGLAKLRPKSKHPPIIPDSEELTPQRPVPAVDAFVPPKFSATGGLAATAISFPPPADEGGDDEHESTIDEPAQALPQPESPQADLPEPSEPSEPETSKATATATDDEDDDEDELIIEAADIDDEDLAGLTDFDDDDLFDEMEATVVSDSLLAQKLSDDTEEQPDVGAQAAQRTVGYRKPREEHYPLVGRSPEALRARYDLLVALGKNAQGSVRARLSVAAAELCEQLGRADEASGHYRDAREADPKDLVALRALRRDAITRGAWEEAAQLLSTEAELPISAHDRAMALTLLAEIQLSQLGDGKAAEKSARTALGLRRDSVATALSLAQATLADGRTAEAFTAYERAADAWDDDAAKAALLVEVARLSERSGQLPRARQLYQKAADADSAALDARIGLARCARGAKDVEAAVASVAQAAELFSEGPVQEAFRRWAARVAHLSLGRAEDALPLLATARGVVSLRARADAASAAGDRQALTDSVEAWAAASGGTERALALVTLAEIRGEDSDLDGADEALRDAALADNTLGTIRVVREVLARKAGDASRLARAVRGAERTPGAALAAAARVISQQPAPEQERSLLREAGEQGEAPATADVLSLDAAAAASDPEGLRAGLRRQAERAAPELKVGALLALVDVASASGDFEAAEAMLGEARELSPGDPVVLRPLGRLLAARDPREAASVWLEEATSASPDRGAFAATSAGRMLAASGDDPTPSFRRALDIVGDYAPAAWALEPIARRKADGESLADINERQAEAAADELEAGGRLVRAALLRAGTDPTAAHALLEKARTACPDDGILYELMLRLGEGMPAEDKAALLAARAEAAPKDLARAAWLRAAAAYIEAGDAHEASTIYRRVLDDASGGDVIAERGLARAWIDADELARLAERRFSAVKQAENDEERVEALARLAELDLYERQDPASAMLSLQSILEVAPGHLPSLRTLETYFMDHNRDEDLAGVERSLARHLEDGNDVAAHARMSIRLQLLPDDAGGEAADRMILDVLSRANVDLWLARRAIGAGRAMHDHDAHAGAAIHALKLLPGPLERAAAALRASEAIEATGDTAAARQAMEEAVEEVMAHPTAAENLARLRELMEDHEAAAEAYESAAKSAEVPMHVVALRYKAAVLFQDQVGNAERAIGSLTEAAKLDPTFADVFDRLRKLLEERGDDQALADIARRRIHAGGEPAVLVELHTLLANLREKLGDRAGARESLRSALAIEGERMDALKRLAELSLEDEDWRAAAEALIRIARLRKDREELRWVFFTLGDIYDNHMPDARRAEAAYRRVLKLIPTDLDAMERLAALYRRENNNPAAAQMLSALADNEVDPDKSRDYRLQLAQALESQGDLRRAESVLEQTRRNAPIDPVVLRALGELYQRQNAQSALSMHLNRAINDFRHALDTDPTDAAAWTGLVEVLDWRGVPDAARVCASAGTSLGITADDLRKVVDAGGGIPGAGSAACDPDLEEVLAPPNLSRVTRAVFRLAGEALEKALPFDLKSLRAQKAGRDHPLRSSVAQVTRWFGISDVQIYVTDQAPRVFLPISGSPVSILVGRELIERTNEAEQLFLLTRAVKVATANLAIAARSRGEHLAVALAGLVRAYDPHYAPSGIDERALVDASKRVAKAVPRRSRDELTPLVIEMAGTHGFEPARIGVLASELGDRVALLSTGSVPGAVGALLKLAAEDAAASGPPSARVEALRRVPEAASLLTFAISNAHFDARSRAGADRA